MIRLGLSAAVCALLSACGSGGPAPSAARCPQRMVLLNDHDACMDRYEARIVVRNGRAEAVSASGTVPDINLTYVEAEQACRNVGYRLCTRAEWTRACAGPSGERKFPYGDTYVSHRCNISEMEDPIESQHLAPGGQFSGCVTPEGISDLIGNALEWTDETPPQADQRELRGAMYSHPGPSAKCVRDERFFLVMTERSAGFRCCTDAAPAR
ncbi:MAG: SUMF1/EgtB/PvdO family nonheme iron enzyme [Kofleriaceae bacterium]|nr:SUMF1/EgtB/PvdO family nonheme iron enzyme [Kofleriaceae bacterium]